MRLAPKRNRVSSGQKNLGHSPCEGTLQFASDVYDAAYERRTREKKPFIKNVGTKEENRYICLGPRPFVCFVVSIEFTLLFSLRKDIYLGRLPVLSWSFWFSSIINPFNYLPTVPNDIGSNTLLLIILVAFGLFFLSRAKPGDGC
ncbi:hypothetical protein V8F33_001892 [Rhypophila sp. PSN 637]